MAYRIQSAVILLSTPLTVGDEKILKGAMVRAGLDPETPMRSVGGGLRPLKSALKKERPETILWLGEKKPSVLITCGAEALHEICGVKPLTAYRGKLVKPSPGFSYIEWVIPTIDAATVRKTGFQYYPYLLADLGRAKRALTGELRMLGEGS